MARTSSNQGFTILESLGYLFVLAFVINICTSLFVVSLRLTRAGESVLERIEGIEEIGRVFTDAVHEAAEVASSAGPYVTSPSEIVLRIPGEKGRFIVLGDVRGDGRFGRLDLELNGTETTISRLTTYRQTPRSIRFVGENGSIENAALLRLELEVDNNGANNTIPAMNSFVAALRCKEDSSL